MANYTLLYIGLGFFGFKLLLIAYWSFTNAGLVIEREDEINWRDWYK